MDYAKLKNAELDALLAKRSLSRGGRKHDMATRLEQDDIKNGAPATTQTALLEAPAPPSNAATQTTTNPRTSRRMAINGSPTTRLTDGTAAENTTMLETTKALLSHIEAHQSVCPLYDEAFSVLQRFADHLQDRRSSGHASCRVPPHSSHKTRDHASKEESVIEQLLQMEQTYLKPLLQNSHQLQKISYSDAARRAPSETLQTPPQLTNATGQKSLKIKVADADRARVGQLSRAEIKERVERGASLPGGEVTAVIKHPSGDIEIAVATTGARAALEKDQTWAQGIAPSAVVKRKRFAVLAHGVLIQDLPKDPVKAGQHITSENRTLHPGLTATRAWWISNPSGKTKGSLIIETDGVGQANRLINEGVSISLNIHICEPYYSHLRLTQCYTCQQFGHTSHRCLNEVRCGHCAGPHHERICQTKDDPSTRSCAACGKHGHGTRAPFCARRVEEKGRLQAAREAAPKSFLDAPSTYFQSEDILTIDTIPTLMQKKPRGRPRKQPQIADHSPSQTAEPTAPEPPTRMTATTNDDLILVPSTIPPTTRNQGAESNE